jgi:hypothetical protein
MPAKCVAGRFHVNASLGGRKRWMSLSSEFFTVYHNLQKRLLDKLINVIS